MSKKSINERIARDVFGLEVRNGMVKKTGSYVEVPDYSNHIEHAWNVVEKLRESFVFQLADESDTEGNRIYCASFREINAYTSEAAEGISENPALAICEAALEAVGTNDSEPN